MFIRLVAAGLLLLLTLAALCASAASPKRVLILNPFGRDVAPFSAVASTFRSTLVEELGAPVNFYEVPLDLERFPESEGESSLASFLAGRLKKQPIDLVVPIGAAGVQFAARYRDRLFPNTPILAVAAAPQLIPPGFLKTNATLVTQNINLRGMIDDMLQLKPETTNIVVVLGNSALERFWINQCRQEFQTFTNRVGFMWLNDLPLGQILERCADLPPHSFILNPLFVVDVEGVPNENEALLRSLHGIANAPLYAYFQSEFGLGPIGGRLFQDTKIGEQSARTAIRILHGESPEDIPPQVLQAPAPVFDWRELQRWQISDGRLPAGSSIRFRVPTFWEQYRWRVVGVLVFCGLQSLLIVGLLVNHLARKRAELVAREADERMTLAAEVAGFGVWVWNITSNRISASATWRRLFGFGADEPIGFEHFFQRIHPEDRRAMEQEIIRRSEGQINHALEYRIILPDGTQRWILSVGRMRECAAEPGWQMIGVAVEITGRKHVEHAMHDLSRRLIRAHETERARLGRELHDDVTQRLAILAIDVGRVESGAARTARAETLRGIREGLVRLSEDIHALSYRLHPALLEDLGLAEALKAEAERFAQQESVPAEITLGDLPEVIPTEPALCLFRVAQEALRNVARHARARQVQISLRALNGGLQLAVHDDGIGFDPAVQRERPSLGLASMRERVFLVEGELDVESAPGRGTTILVTVPITEGKIPKREL